MHAVDYDVDHVLAGQPWHIIAPSGRRGAERVGRARHAARRQGPVGACRSSAGHWAHVMLAVVLRAVLTYLPTEHVPHRLQAVELAETERFTEGVHAQHGDRPTVCVNFANTCRQCRRSTPWR